MEPKCGFEPLLSTWVGWELSQHPELAPLLQTSKFLTTQALELSSLVTVISTRHWVSALQMYASSVRLAQHTWLPLAAVPRIASAESQNEWDAQQVDAVFSRQAA